MNTNDLHELGYQVKIHREHLGQSQSQLAETVGDGVNRSNIAHLEQGLRLPSEKILEKICLTIGLPEQLWKPFMSEESRRRIEFEAIIGELFGASVSTHGLDDITISVDFPTFGAKKVKHFFC